jgi:ribonucleotide reductase alpha subunit
VSAYPARRRLFALRTERRARRSWAAGVDSPARSVLRALHLENASVNPTVLPTEKRASMVSPKTAAEASTMLEAIDPPNDVGETSLSENAIKVLERRYLKKDPETGKVCETPKQLLWRVATHIAKGELRFPGGTPQRALAVAREFYDVMAKRYFMPNSPTLMNAGR